MNKELLKEKNLIFPEYLFSLIKTFNLTLKEFLVLGYFWNYPDTSFDIGVIAKCLKLEENEVLEAFNGLLSKKLITMDTKKDISGKMIEFINLEILYDHIDSLYKEKKNAKESSDIYTTFETEFGRPISSIEYEIIGAWLEKGFSEELINGALKEAVYNGVSNLRYIDKILYEWQRKGYKNMEEVNSHNIRRSETESSSLFDYNWLDENE